MSGRIEVQVPDLGEFEDVDVVEILVSRGDPVGVEDPLIVLESDKATMEVPSSGAGTIAEIRVSVGDKVSAGDVIVVLEGAEGKAQTEAAGEPEEKKGKRRDEAEPGKAGEADERAREERKPAREDEEARADRDAESKRPEPEREEPVRGEPEAEEPSAGPRRPPESVDETPGERVPAHASPAVRRFARELGVEVEQVEGSGPKGRILRSDVQEHVKRIVRTGGGTAPPAAAPAVDPAKFGPVDREPLSRLRRTAAANLHRAWTQVPHVTQHDEADVTDLETFRAGLRDEAGERGVKLTPVAFVVKASAAALLRFERVSSQLDASGETLLLKRYVHVGVAVDTPDGLVVPVVRDADRKGVFELAAEIADLAGRARSRRLSPGEMQGASFTVTSLGHVAGTGFTPIVNAPEVAILGVSPARIRPVWRDGAFVPRKLMPLSLSYDHRVIDGVLAARFTAWICEALGDLRRLLL